MDIYRFDRSQPRSEVFSIDTPPPTVSGSLHVGHIFSYTHTDIIARYQRMRGKAVFYPMGWDDNGLATERRVENTLGIRCDPSLSYDPTFKPPAKPPSERADYIPVSRQNFIELCQGLCEEYEQAYEQLWRNLGLSVDWSMTYATIGKRSRRVSQRAFLHNLARGEAYLAEAPCLWDVTFQTAVAQAELEEREVSSNFVKLNFEYPPAGNSVTIATTRPELLAACVALVVHPEDHRFAQMVGKSAVSPLFGVEVPILSHHLADPSKGTGIAMICTFGDLTDVVWWRELGLPIRSILAKDGKLVSESPPWLTTSQAKTAFGEIAGLPAAQARAKSIELLSNAGVVTEPPQPIKHAVKFYEKGDKPVEIITTRQWYLKNGAQDQALRNQLLKRGEELKWHPPHMRVRYENWIEGLSSDWLISRQRYFGVPFPVWYPLDENAQPKWQAPLLPQEEELPVDPQATPPAGYQEEQRGKPNGFIGDPDIMDTWATSSLTPYIACGWGDDPDLLSRTFPMDLRPQAHEIIRTWLFTTVLRSELESDCLPWKHAAISGWILDPDRKKMSKSKGNVVTPQHLLDKHTPDGVRYWAALAKPGTDVAFDEQQMKIGKRLAIKLLNASRFALQFDSSSPYDPAQATLPLDRSLLSFVSGAITQASKELEAFDYAAALQTIERAFWSFCDFYIELSKSRLYTPSLPLPDPPLPSRLGGDPGRGRASTVGYDSARAALLTSTDLFLRAFAPYLPFTTEQVWDPWKGSSVHLASWPRPVRGEETTVYEAVVSALRAVRAAKSAAQLSVGAEIPSLEISGSPALLEQLEQARGDLQAAARCEKLVLVPNETGELSATLGNRLPIG